MWQNLRGFVQQQQPLRPHMWLPPYIQAPRNALFHATGLHIFQQLIAVCLHVSLRDLKQHQKVRNNEHKKEIHTHFCRITLFSGLFNKIVFVSMNNTQFLLM